MDECSSTVNDNIESSLEFIHVLTSSKRTRCKHFTSTEGLQRANLARSSS